MELVYTKFCPFARASEVLLQEAGLEYTALEEENRLDFPTLKLQDTQLYGFFAIAEYLSQDQTDQHEKRMWLEIVLNQCWHESAKVIIEVRIRSIKNSIRPNTGQLHNARIKLGLFLSELDKWLIERNYLTLTISYADLLLGSIISYLDYLNEVSWNNYTNVAEWYSRLKSRPSFRFILDDVIPGLKPASHYKLIDF